VTFFSHADPHGDLLNALVWITIYLGVALLVAAPATTIATRRGLRAGFKVAAATALVVPVGGGLAFVAGSALQGPIDRGVAQGIFQATIFLLIYVGVVVVPVLLLGLGLASAIRRRSRSRPSDKAP
jgi:hypothetical protein